MANSLISPFQLLAANIARPVSQAPQSSTEDCFCMSSTTNIRK
jgi:hypothetical protein